MEEEKLKIVEMKKTKKEVNKALLNKSIDIVLAAVSAACVCFEAAKYVDTNEFSCIPFALLLLNSYAYFLTRARKNTEIVNNNLDKELDLEELVEYQGLSK